MDPVPQTKQNSLVCTCEKTNSYSPAKRRALPFGPRALQSLALGAPRGRRRSRRGIQLRVETGVVWVRFAKQQSTVVFHVALNFGGIRSLTLSGDSPAENKWRVPNANACAVR